VQFLNLFLQSHHLVLVRLLMHQSMKSRKLRLGGYRTDVRLLLHNSLKGAQLELCGHHADVGLLMKSALYG